MKISIINRLLQFCLLALSLATLCSAMTSFAQGNNSTLLVTITNPTPAAFDVFGGAVAALGNDAVLVGSEGASQAYLFKTDGTLLTTFNFPDPAAGGFGASLVGVGNDQVLVGAYGYFVNPKQVGRAYLFNTNGTLLTTFTNPNPAVAEAFGWSVAAAGSDRVLIGTVGGSAYLFNINGVLLTTFTNPAPTVVGFGSSVAAVGSNRVLIGAPQNNTGGSQAGVAYLFSTNGAWLTTLTNPFPVASDNFGTAVAAVGNDRMLISAIDYGGVKGTGGAAYLFNTNGTLLATFANPTPEARDYFGCSVSAVGSTRVLIGAYQDGAGEFQAGAAYLFSTNGALLNTFTNPTPARQDWFGWSVAAVGNDRVIIGGVWDDTGATDSGSVYLFDLPYPQLGITRSAATVSLKWVTPETGLALQQAGALGTATIWSNTSDSVSITGLTNVVQQTLVTTNRFFRLHRP